MLTKKIALPWPATPAPDCIIIASSRVPSAVAVNPYDLCMEKPLQYIDPDPATTAPAPAALPASAVVAVRPIIIPASEAAAVPYPASTCTESISDSLGPASAPTTPELAPARLDSDLLLAVIMATALAIQRAPCLNFSLTGKQIPILSPVPATVNHLASPLLKNIHIWDTLLL